MHPAQRRHVYSMLEMIKHSIRSIEIAMTDYESEKADFRGQPVGLNRVDTAPSESQYMTPEEEELLAKALGVTEAADVFAEMTQAGIKQDAEPT